MEEVFDFVADERNEPQYNAPWVHAELISDGPIGLEARFRTELETMGRTMPMVVEFTGFERPWRLESVTRSSMMETKGTLTFESVPSGTRMRWSWDVRPPPASFLRLCQGVQVSVEIASPRTLGVGRLAVGGSDALSRPAR